LAIMGGDGSLGCFIDDITQDEVIAKNLMHLILVPLPYGTGNDLSRSLGWTHREGPWGRSLETLATALLNAKKEAFDVWDVEIYAEEIHGYGRGGTTVPLEHEKDSKSGLSIYRKSLCCYINMSLDSVISNGKSYFILIKI
jgi:diacylglycerol kinase family enzyme